MLFEVLRELEGEEERKGKREMWRWKCVVRHGCRCRGDSRPMSLATFSFFSSSPEGLGRGGESGNTPWRRGAGSVSIEIVRLKGVKS